MEHRLGERYVRRDRLRIGQLPQVDHIAQLHDISASGAFVLTSLQLSRMTPLAVVFDLHARHWSKLVMHAHVTRATSQGLGIEWDEFCPGLMSHLFSDSHAPRQ